jgi:small subunit ribosomal protein S11
MPVRGQHQDQCAHPQGPKRTIAGKKGQVTDATRKEATLRPQEGAEGPAAGKKKNVPHGARTSKARSTTRSCHDPQGNVIAWASSGHVGFKGSRKVDPFARAAAAENAARKAQEHGVKRSTCS